MRSLVVGAVQSLQNWWDYCQTFVVTVKLFLGRIPGYLGGGYLGILGEGN